MKLLEPFGWISWLLLLFKYARVAMAQAPSRHCFPPLTGDDIGDDDDDDADHLEPVDDDDDDVIEIDRDGDNTA